MKTLRATVSRHQIHADGIYLCCRVVAPTLMESPMNRDMDLDIVLTWHYILCINR